MSILTLKLTAAAAGDVSVALTAVVIWKADAHNVSLRYVVGVGMVVVGAGFMILHLTVTNEYLHRRFGDPGASRMRQLWRGGWVGVLIGAATIAVEFFLSAGW